MAIYKTKKNSDGGVTVSSVSEEAPDEVAFDINFNPRNVYNVDNMSQPSDPNILSTGVAVNFVERVIWAKHPVTGELVSIGMNEEQMRDIFQIKNAVTTDTTVTTDAYIPSLKRVKALELGSIVQKDDQILVADKVNALVVDVEDDDTVIVTTDDDLDEGELGRQNTRRLNKPGDTLKAYDQQSYLPVATPEDEKPFIFDPTDYDGLGIPLPNDSSAEPHVKRGEIKDITDGMNHLFGLAGNGLKSIINAGIKVGLPLQQGMTLREVIAVIHSIAGVNLTLNGYSYVTQKSVFKFRRNCKTSMVLQVSPAMVETNETITGNGRLQDNKAASVTSGVRFSVE